VNSVLLRGINDDEAPALLDWAIRNGYSLRFIEQMPLDPQHGWSRDEMVSADEILSQLSVSHRLSPLGAKSRGSSPAEEFLIGDGPATVGIIGSVTRPFCADCDRLRLTADGQILNCLFAREEDDLRAILRSGSAGIDTEIAKVLFSSVAKKKAGHGIGEPGFEQPTRPMSAIGG
jgi:cyclic pyranopterin phosphate synthase